MARVSQDFTVEELMRPSHRFAVELVNAGDVPAAYDAMREAARAVAAVSHPDEPDDSYVSFVSTVYRTESSAWFFADAKDLDAYPEVARALVNAITDATNRPALTDALLQWTDREPPTETGWMPEETPLVLPPGFPLPPRCRVVGTKLVASRATWYRAEWHLRGDGNAADVASAYYRALGAEGWRVSEIVRTVMHSARLLRAAWTMTNDEAEGSVGVAGVRDGAPVRAEEVDPDDPEWSDDFARGEAWLGHLQLHPGASGWKPYQD